MWFLWSWLGDFCCCCFFFANGWVALMISPEMSVVFIWWRRWSANGCNFCFSIAAESLERKERTYRCFKQSIWGCVWFCLQVIFSFYLRTVGLLRGSGLRGPLCRWRRGSINSCTFFYITAVSLQPPPPSPRLNGLFHSLVDGSLDFTAVIFCFICLTVKLLWWFGRRGPS